MDVNGDGHLDILSGTYSRHGKDMAGLLQVLPGDGEGGFAEARPLTGTDGEPLIIEHAGREEVTTAICTRPFAVDWTGDGNLDLVVGNFAGSFHLFRGVGPGRYAPRSEEIPVSDRPGAHGDPFCIDWDGDGDLDLVAGASGGGVYLARNTAGPGRPPRLARFEVLIPVGELPGHDAMLGAEDLKGPQRSTRVWVADVDGDGRLDVLVGDSVTLRRPADGLDAATFEERRKAWEMRQKELLERMQDEATREKASQEYSKHYQARGEFLHEERTGFVWLYRQKPARGQDD